LKSTQYIGMWRGRTKLGQDTTEKKTRSRYNWKHNIGMCKGRTKLGQVTTGNTYWNVERLTRE